MAMTSKAITTISYNSPEYLKIKLDALVKTKTIEMYAFIKHKGEYGDKDHIHMYIMPNKKIDTMDLASTFKEIDPSNPKPLGVTKFMKCTSDIDWLMYSIHDEQYLELKGETKEYHYQIENVITNNQDYLEQLLEDWKSKPHYKNKNDEIYQMLIEHNLNALLVARMTNYPLRDVLVWKQQIELEKHENERKKIDEQYLEIARQVENPTIHQKVIGVSMGGLPPVDVDTETYVDSFTGEIKKKVIVPKPTEINEDDDLPF